MPVAVRVIPCLDVDAGRVVKGVNFRDLRDAGDPVELAAAYDAEGADELVFLDITASSAAPGHDARRGGAHRGPGVHPADGGRRGAQHRTTWTGCCGPARTRCRSTPRRSRRPELLTEVAGRFGAQCVVVSVDARRAAGRPGGFEVTTHGGRRGTGLDAVAWARRAALLGAGEILLNSMDADGTQGGFDLEMIAAVRAAVDVPVIASGGAGQAADFAPAVAAGADAVLAASVFHFGEIRIGEVKQSLRAGGPPGPLTGASRCARLAVMSTSEGTARAGIGSRGSTRGSPRGSSGTRTG